MQIHVYFLFFILGLLDTNKLLAQTLLQINHIENRIDLTSHSELFIDSTGDKKIEQVISLHFKPLKEFSFPKKVIQNYKQHYWLRFGLLNTSPDTLNLLFTAGFHHHIRLYEPILIAESSQYLSKSDRPFYVDAKYLPIILPPLHQKVFYVEIKDLIDEGFEIKPALLTRSHAEHIKLYSIYDNQQLLFLNTGFIYILIFMGIFTLLQFYFSHEKYFLFYSLYLFSMSLFNYWGFSHVALISNFMTEFSFWRFSLRQEFYILLTNFFYFNFLYEFLQLRKIDKPFGLYLYRFKWIIFFFLLLDIVLTLIVRRLDWAFYAMFVAQIVLSAGGIITFYYLIKIKGTAVNFIKIGSLMLLFGAIIGYTAIYFDFYPSSNELFPYYPHLYFAILTLIEILFFSLGIGYKFLETTQQKTKLQKEIAESTLDVLRLQMNPHFIFNSLNSIKSYVLKERNIEAAQYLNDFAQLFRRVLNLSRDQIISLDEEIQTLKLYVILEQKRFQNRFEFCLEIDDSIDPKQIMIPTLLLQPYVENAIKHGLNPKPSGGLLRIGFYLLNKCLVCEIEDNGVGRSQAQNHSNHVHKSRGMNILNEKLDLLRKTQNWDIKVFIVDKTDNSTGTPIGTIIRLHIPFFDTIRHFP